MASICSTTALRRLAGAPPVWRSPRMPFASFQRRLVHCDHGALYKKNEHVGDKRFNQFNVGGNVFVVTGGGRGLGLCMAEGLAEAGGMGERCIRSRVDH